MLRDNKGRLPSASLPHYSNLICPAAAQEAAQGSYTTFKASCILKTGEDECAGTLTNCINSMNAPLGCQITCFTPSHSKQSSLSGHQ